jgi:hypothetical protein
MFIPEGSKVEKRVEAVTRLLALTSGYVVSAKSLGSNAQNVRIGGFCQ